ncbi:hypothetical protein SERLADRAFT_350394 [Serpula lacrymans var. lacrymans S7.9]|uniref:DUF6589 domain-containing protein n=2 Tax=Serpula lacrymans var. lacrymans TaxID=341189 RepID=F8P3W0_SERL9|nr:uncharacterized protein SERLADRAFT_350394 [Serpula lacrymans var. lacrymans S7.9]EGO22209.1 hypothetical protein SERLADRAFT_350394 [Serpula lacrymans var. lacrymans S7.9]
MDTDPAPNSSLAWASKIMQEQYASGIRKLTSESSGRHFNTMKATAEQIEMFCIAETATQYQALTPYLWELLGYLLNATTKISKVDRDRDRDYRMSDVEAKDTYWDHVDKLDLEGIIENLASSTNKRKHNCKAAIAVKKVVILSIMMQSTNQKSDALQSVIGIFLQSSHSPEKVIDAMACIGVSISQSAIHSAIWSLLAESHRNICALGKTMLASYAYANFDVDLKSHQPVAKKSSDTLKHLTLGLLFPLQHGVTLRDLKCSQELWEKSTFNPDIIPSDGLTRETLEQLLSIHPDVPNTSGLSCRQQFNSWKFMHNLCHQGPAYFASFKSQIGPLAPTEPIPVVKTSIIAARAMDINNLTVPGNIQAVVESLAQGGITEPSADGGSVTTKSYLLWCTQEHTIRKMMGSGYPLGCSELVVLDNRRTR